MRARHHALLDIPRRPLVLARRTEERHGRRAHRRGEVHRHRVDTDEKPRPCGERAELLERQLAGQIDGLARRAVENLVDERGLLRRGGQHHLMAFGGQPVGQQRVALRRPALERPARRRMHVDERLRQRQRLDLLLGVGARHEMHPALVHARIDADAAQRVEIDFHLMAIADQRVEMAEALAPPAPAFRHVRRHAMARAEQARKPGAARMLGEMHQQVIVPRAQRAEERALFGELSQGSERAPLASYAVKLGQRGMARQHGHGVVVDQRIDLEARRVRFQHVQHRRREQHVAVVPQLDDQRARAFPQRNGILHHPARVP